MTWKSYEVFNQHNKQHSLVNISFVNYQHILILLATPCILPYITPMNHNGRGKFLSKLYFVIWCLLLSCWCDWWLLRIQENTKILLKNVVSREKEHQNYDGKIAQEHDVSSRPWFMNDGKLRPEATKNRNETRLWPEEDTQSDRIVNQLMFNPVHLMTGRNVTMKRILAHIEVSQTTEENPRFDFHACPVNSCVHTYTFSDIENADAIVLRATDINPLVMRKQSSNQIFILHLLESPTNIVIMGNYLVNWTATYRSDSDLVTPYARWVYYNEGVKQKRSGINLAANKTKKVAWFVSQCNTTNNRWEFAQELTKHIKIDIYGNCSPSSSNYCPREMTEECFEMLRQEYKFYLAFENSNCKEYITEKFYINALRNAIIPIVMGARQEDYEKVAPYHSFIHVDNFTSVAELGSFLQELDNNDDLYNSYFSWHGTGEFINTYFMCRLCAMLHDPNLNQRPIATKWYNNITHWWMQDQCVTGSWPHSS